MILQNIISLIKKNKQYSLQQYSIPYKHGIKARVVHEYVTNCYVLDYVSNYFVGICTSYGLIIIIWIMALSVYYSNQPNTLQKAMLVIPIFKLLRIAIYTFYINDCPWNDHLTGRYLMMALVTVSTIYQTVFVAILLLISKGWILIRGSLSRQQATLTTMLMGAVYLTYSVYYVSVNVNGIKNLIGMVINILYIGLFIYVIRNSLSVLGTLKMHYEIVRNNDVMSL